MKSKTITVGVSIGLALLLTACVPPQNRGNKGQDASATSTATASTPKGSYVRIGQTPLKNIFADSTSGGTKSPAFPRVALRVTSLKGKGTVTFDPNATGCLFFSATIWHSNTKSEAVKEFAVCTDDLDKSPYTVIQKVPGWGGKMEQVTYHEYDNSQWITWARKSETKLSNTAYKRTDGPLPPRFALDQDAMNQRGWNSIARGELMSHFAYALRNMGYMLNRDDMDGRLWVVSVEL